MNVSQAYCNNHFTLHVNQIIMPYTLNLHVLYANYLPIELEKNFKGNNWTTKTMLSYTREQFYFLLSGIWRHL